MLKLKTTKTLFLDNYTAIMFQNEFKRVIEGDLALHAQIGISV